MSSQAGRAIASAVYLLGVLVVLTACQTGELTPARQFLSSETEAFGRAPSDAKDAAHLYVAVSTGTFHLSIERFGLDKGIPEKIDRVYNRYGGLVAVSGNGTLYATSNAYPNIIYAFPPRGATPVREIQVAPRCGPSSFTVLSAITADRNGYLFALLYTYAERARSRGWRDADSSPAVRTPCNGIVVYAPNASGKATPVRAIRFADGAALNGLAVDTNDNLYLSRNYPSEVEEFSNAIADPKRTRTFRGKHIGTIRSVATDSEGDLFIANAQRSYSSGWIDRYVPSAKGRGAPSSTILLAGSGPHLLYSIAVRGHYLYADDTARSVELFYARKNGKQQPFDSRAAPNVSSVAVGP